MKKLLTIVFTSLSAMLILDSMNAAHAIFMLVLAGVIPGTDIIVEAGRMLEVFAVLTGFTIARSIIYFSKLFKNQAASLSTVSKVNA